MKLLTEAVREPTCAHVMPRHGYVDSKAANVAL